MIPIESTCQLNEITIVYNLRVADHHTYFVGGALWGWDVWVHNAYKVPKGFHDHHIISDKNKLTKNHELLQLAGFDLQSRKNKIFLPTDGSLHSTRSIHKGRHRVLFSSNLAKQIDQIVEFGKQNSFTQEQYLKVLQSLMSKEGQLLRSGKRALNQNIRQGAK